MSRKDYAAIADIISAKHSRLLGAGHNAGNAILYDISGQVADYFASRNQQFDRKRFMNACEAKELR